MSGQPMTPEGVHLSPRMAVELTVLQERIQRINKTLDNCEKILRENGEANGRTATNER